MFKPSQAFKRLMAIATALLVITSCGPSNTPEQQFSDFNDKNTDLQSNVIYGVDGRLEPYQLTDDRVKNMARSTVALVRKSDLEASGENFNLKGKNYGQSRNLCATEPFREQDTVAFCSGFLVRSDIIVTAGHCIETLSDCQNTVFVFGLGLENPNQNLKTVSKQQTYTCEEVIKTFQISSGADFAVIRLDRPVRDRTPLKLRNSSEDGAIQIGEPLTVIGHPVGLPQKITTGGRVRSIASQDFFVGDVDTYGGNSGSAVFNERTGKVEGILVRGEVDFVQSGACVKSKVCAEGTCRGEDITRISVVAPFLPAETNPDPIQEPSTVVRMIQVNRNIPDNNKTGITSSLSLETDASAKNLLVHVEIQHTFIGDLSVQLILPNGRILSLHERAGGSHDNLKTSFEVTSKIRSIRDQQRLEQGNYRLVVKDLAKRDVGRIMNWGIEYSPAK